MPRQFKPSILTANHLLSGEVVYFDAKQNWVTKFAEAKVFASEDDAEAALAQVGEDEVVGAYLVSVDVDGNQHSPDHFREEFRAKGPSNYHHGKQENV